MAGTPSSTKMIDYQSILDKYYPVGHPAREILLRHSRQVADLALRLNARMACRLDAVEVEAAAMLHDIGIIRTDAPGIGCSGENPYLMHGVLGAAMLRDEGVPETIAAVAERHTGTGLTADDIRRQGLPLPVGDYLPRTPLEKLICYADKFYSKSGDMQLKAIDRVRRSIARFGDDAIARFDALVAAFGLPY